MSDGKSQWDFRLILLRSFSNWMARSDKGILCWMLFLALSSGIVQQWDSRSISLHSAPKISPLRCAVTSWSLSAILVASAMGGFSRPFQRALVSSVDRHRSRWFSLAGALTDAQGVDVRMSLSTAKLNIRRTQAKVRFAKIGAPRLTMSSSSRTTSRLVMSLALRLPQRGLTSFLRARSSACQERFRFLAHFSIYSWIRPLTVAESR